MLRANGVIVGVFISVLALALAPAAVAATKAEPATSHATGSQPKSTATSPGKAPAGGKSSATSATAGQPTSPQKSTSTSKPATATKSTTTKTTTGNKTSTGTKSAATAKSSQGAKSTKKAEAGQKSLGTFGAWWAYTEGAADNRVCYAGSRPSKKEGKVAGRRDAYLLVTNRPGQKATGEISLSSGYPFKEGSDALATIGDKKFKMFTRGDNAWTYDAQADKAMVAALKTGKQMVVKGTAKGGQVTTDTYALGGFPKALAAIDKACGG